MKKALTIFLFFLSSLFARAQSIQDIINSKPNPPRLVNDYAHVLTSDQLDALEQKLVHYDDSTSTQIVIVTIKTLNDYPLEDAALGILRNWGVGNKKTNNGIVILAAIDDHKIRIEVGYGLEGAIPDITAEHIIQEYIGDDFRAGNYYRGFDQASDALIRAAAGEYQAPEGYRKQKGKSIGAILPILVIIIIIILSIFRGGRGGGMMSRRGFGRTGVSPLWWLLPLSGGWGSGGGGGWSGGGGGGGGFGGFGGGGGGGGGASGGW
jgi:uncharacterized protein